MEIGSVTRRGSPSERQDRDGRIKIDRNGENLPPGVGDDAVDLEEEQESGG